MGLFPRQEKNCLHLLFLWTSFILFLKNDRTNSRLRWIPPEKVGGCMFLRMLWKKIYIHTHKHTYIFFSLCFLIFLSSVECFFFSFLSYLGWSLIFCKACNDWVDKEDEIWHEEYLVYILFLMIEYMFLHCHDNGLEDCIKNWFRYELRVGSPTVLIFLKMSTTEWNHFAIKITIL